MSHGNGVVDGESLPAMVPDETAFAVPCHLYQRSSIRESIVQDRKHRGTFALHDSSANGKAEEAPTKAQVSLAESAVVEAEAKARVAVAEALEAEAKARKANAEASLAEAEVKEKNRAAEAEAEERIRAAKAEADARIRVAEAEATTKIRVAAAEAREADLKILKLGKEIDVFTGECEVKEYLCFLSVRPSLCLSLTACFSD